MKKLHFNILIEASPAKVWKVLWDKQLYMEWTKVFAEGSRAETDWQEGSKILFLDGNGQGMVSRVAKSIPERFMSIEHLGFYDNGKEDLESEKVKDWAGVLENYTLDPTEKGTKLSIEMDTNEEYKEYFEETWPEALKIVKELSER